ncbi:DUF4349 domain-containing protein [Cohnella caldifontis]|uniref:DUF4349 domain-containing protein n=1 Tax=Cohnella caldifontis TaxID=3027471 RepID=UPI0023EC09A5|nr:DUF4349 domain-containing protein [Cohnella sp. YIM B05605]
MKRGRFGQVSWERGRFGQVSRERESSGNFSWNLGRLGKAGLAALLAAILLALSACSAAQSDKASEAAQDVMAVDQYGGALEAPKAEAMADTAFTSAKTATTAANSAAQPSASAVEAGAASGGIGPIADPQSMGRKVIYKANVSMNVPDFDQAESQLRDAIHLSGSYILQFNNSMDASGKGATYVIKVPADGFSSFIERLRRIEKDLQLQMEGSDVTEEYVDLSARLQAKQTVETRLLSFMDKATGSDDLVKFSNELAAVQEQIEQIKGRMRYLDQNVAYSTVNVRLYEGKAAAKTEEKEKEGFGERLAGALTGSAKALGQFGQALLVFLAALLPVAAVAAVIGIPAYLLIRARSRSRREEAELRRKAWNEAVPQAVPALPLADEGAATAPKVDEHPADPSRSGKPNDPATSGKPNDPPE